MREHLGSSRKSMTSGRIIVPPRGVTAAGQRVDVRQQPVAQPVELELRLCRRGGLRRRRSPTSRGTATAPCTRSSGQNVAYWNQRVSSSRHSSTSSGRGFVPDHLRGHGEAADVRSSSTGCRRARSRARRGSACAGCPSRRRCRRTRSPRRSAAAGEGRAREDEDALVRDPPRAGPRRPPGCSAARRRSPCARPSRAPSGSSSALSALAACPRRPARARSRPSTRRRRPC